MNKSTAQFLGVGLAAGVLVWLVLRRKVAGSILSVSDEPTWRGDPSTCRCYIKRASTSPDGKPIRVEEVEPDITLCVEDLPSSCFGGGGGIPDYTPGLDPKTSDG